MSEQKLTVENLVDGAIIEGFKNATGMFLESLEDSLQKHVLIAEAGDAQSVLQEMIDSAEEEVVQEQSVEQLNELNEKLAKVLK
jgi:hypothetical protein